MIRAANQSDLPELAAAMVRLQDAHAQAFPEVYRRFEADEALAHLSGLLTRSDAFIRVTEDDGSVVGHVVLVVETRPESMFTHPQRFGHVSQIEVEPNSRRRGYGRALLADCDQLAKSHGLASIVLEVWAFNTSGKKFFEVMGYQDFGSKMLRSV